MKNFAILSLIAIMLCFGLQAQVIHKSYPLLGRTGSFVAPNASNKDTTINTADTSYLYKEFDDLYDLLISATFTKISGTVTYTVILQGTDDLNGTWFTLSNVQSGTLSSSFADTVNATNASTQTKYWIYGGAAVHRYRYIRLRIITTSGIMAPTGTVYVYKRED